MSLTHLNDDQLIHYYKLQKTHITSGNSQRKEISDRCGEDTKFLYHIIRLFDEAEQILLDGDIDLQRAKEPMKAIRRGDWTFEDVQSWMMEKEKALEVAYTNCKLPVQPDEEKLRQLLLQCLEIHYGSLDKCVANTTWAEQALKDIDVLMNTVRNKLYA